MTTLFEVTAGTVSFNPTTNGVRFKLENDDLDEMAFQIPLSSLQMLLSQLESLGASTTPRASTSAVPAIGETFVFEGYQVGAKGDGVRLTIHFQVKGGGRTIPIEMSAKQAADMADDLIAAAAPPDLPRH